MSPRHKYKAAFRLARAKWNISARDNLADYAPLAKRTGLLAAFLWPGFGWLCASRFGFREDMAVRAALGLSTLFLWFQAHQGKFGRIERFGWILTGAVGLVWMPWNLFLVNDRPIYWAMSLVFFAIGLGVLIRGVDLFLAISLGGFAVVFHPGQDLNQGDIAPLAVQAITIWLSHVGIHDLRTAKRRIANQSEVIRQQNQKLRDQDRQKDEFTAAIAHDLRTPLAVALSLSEDLVCSDLSRAARKRLESLTEALRQMRRQSDDLLDLERFQLGVARIDAQIIDVRDWLRRFEEGFASMARSRGLTFELALPAGPMMARIDPVRIEAALFNLVANAFKFTPPDGHVAIHLRHLEPKGLVLGVLDDGEGIPADSLQRIFDRFQQVDRGPGTYTSGSGIGLSLVREIVQAHGGHIRVQSTEGLGSLFEIVLENVVLEDSPKIVELVPPPPPAPNHLSQRPSRMGGRLALVAEDQQLLRHILHDLLERIVPVATAKDGREALRMIRQLRPDIVITDYSMPGLNGLELLANLRADPSTKDLPVVFLTGDPHSLRERLAEEPCLEILGKPFDQAELLACVGHMLGVSRREDSNFENDSFGEVAFP